MTRNATTLFSKLFWPTVAVVCGIALLLNLGVWQLRRLEEKSALLSKIASRVNRPLSDIPAEAAWPELTIADLDYTPAKASGTFMHEDEALVFEPAAKGETGLTTKGFAVLTPLKLDDGRIIIVDRGFVPEHLGTIERRAAAQTSGKATVIGKLRAPQRRGAFTPADAPGKGIWYTRDPAAIADVYHLAHVAPVYLEADATPNPGGWPKGGENQISIPNHHLEYALTWFGLAATLVGFYAFFAWVQWREGAKKST